MIDGVFEKELRRIPDERGSVMHMLRETDPHFTRFGEIYFSTVNKDAVKAWKKHLKMTQTLAVPVGMIRLVIFDDRDGSSTKGEVDTFEIGGDNYSLLRIPPLLWYGFSGLSETPALIANCADMAHDPSEVVRCEVTDAVVPYTWT